MSAQASSTLRRSSAENSSRVRPRTLLSCATGVPEHDRRHTIDVGVPDQQGAFAVVVIHLASVGPVGWVGGRSLQAVHDTGNAGQDQLDLCVQTAPRLVLSLIVNGHTDSLSRLLGVGNCLALLE